MRNEPSRLLAFCTTERGLIGLALFRVLTGLCLTYWYCIHYHQRSYLWGPTGVVPLELWRDSGSLSLYALSPSRFWFEATYHLGILAAILWTLGWRTRLTGIAAFVFRYSLYTRNTLIAHGGDNVSVIVHLYLLAANAGAVLSLDAANRSAMSRSEASDSFAEQVEGLVHNAALVAAVTQVCVMYTVAGLHKVTGPMWQSGTALYYIMRTQEFGSPYSELVYRNQYLVVAGSYATVAFQLGFLPALLNRYARYVWLLGGVLFHAAIAVFMGLTTFSWLMVAIYPLFLTDAEWVRIRRWLTDVAVRSGELGRRMLRGWSSEPWEAATRTGRGATQGAQLPTPDGGTSRTGDTR